MDINQHIDACIDGEDWIGAALALLAHPYSPQLGRTFSEPLARIVFEGDIDDAEWTVKFRADQIDYLEREVSA